MARQAPKRRKLSHSPSDDGDDAASFASFGESEEEQNVAVSKRAQTKSASTSAQNGAVKQNQTAHKAAHGRNGQVTAGRSVSTNAGATFKSNMFKLQVDELLGQVRPRSGKKEAAAEAALHKIKDAIKGIPGKGPFTVEEAQRELTQHHNVAVFFPTPRPDEDAQYKLEYREPASIDVVGSYRFKIAARTSETLTIDMPVTMPSALFQEKDYLNHRYYYKRAYYLSCIAAGLKEALPDKYNLQFDYFHGNVLQHILTIQPKEASGKRNWQINIIPAISDKIFTNEKLLPSRNCCRQQLLDGAIDSADDKRSTSFYNSTIQAERQVTAYLKLIHGAAKTCDAFEDACLLGRIWLRQRGLSSDMSRGGFGNFEWTALMAVLLTTGGPSDSPALSTGYSSYQLFKATLQYIVVKDMIKQPVILEADGIKLTSSKGYPICFDGSRSHNLLYRMAPWSYKQLRNEARTTLSMLGDSPFDQFENTFILRQDNDPQKYDYILTVSNSISTGLNSSENEDRDMLRQRVEVYDVLSRGLGDRVTSIVVRLPDMPRWETNAMFKPAWNRKGDLTVAVNINPANAARAVDHGPSAENKKAAEDFRKFWGDKAELRRFKDGSILESLVWSAKEGGPSVVQQIITYLMGTHFPSCKSTFGFKGSDLSDLIRPDLGTAPFQPIMEAFKTLETDIRAMEDMPLTVRQITAADSQLRYSSTDLPLSSTQQRMKIPADVVIQFEGSGRWPDDLVAVQKTKIAFLLKLSELFQGSGSEVESKVGLENTSTDVLNQAYLDIIYPTGFSFRLRIHHDREQTLLDHLLKSPMSSPPTRESAALALSAYKRDFIKTPAHTQAVQKLCTRYPALSPAMRLTKQWFSAHLLSNHFPAAVIELFVIRTFTQPYPWSVPSSAHTAFLRTLSFLSRWDWRTDALIVDLDNDLKPVDVSAMNTRFEAWRKLDPGMNRVVLFLGSKIDTEGISWTDGGRVGKVAAGRMSALAKAAVEEVETKGVELEAGVLFESGVREYDFVVHLATAGAAGAAGGRGGGKKKKKAEYKNMQVSAQLDSAEAVVGFDPVKEFLDEVQEVYGSAIMLFYGGVEKGVVAGLWSPVVVAERAWKVNLAYSTVPAVEERGVEVVEEEEEEAQEDGVMAVINKQGILAEIARLGGDLIERIEIMGA